MTFEEWMDKLDEVAAEECYERNTFMTSQERAVWEKHYNKGLTPKEAWDAVPFTQRR